LNGWTNRGGGGASGDASGGSRGVGGSGVVFLRHPGDYRIGTTTGSNVTTTVVGSNILYSFYSSGTITF
jgi:hypothetical protein